MQVVKGRKYRILEFPILGLPDSMNVRVVNIYDNALVGKTVAYRYNWPFPMIKEATLKEFKTWILEESHGN